MSKPKEPSKRTPSKEKPNKEKKPAQQDAGTEVREGEGRTGTKRGTEDS